MKQPSISIVGAGRVGTALAPRLAQAGYRINEIVCRNQPSSLRKARGLAREFRAKLQTTASATLQADVVWFCVPDAEISRAAAALATRKWKGKIAFQASGTMSSDVLAALSRRGASVASVHPLMTFAPGSRPEFSGVMFGVEGDRRAVRQARKIVQHLGGFVVELRKQDKAAYHSFATMTCPMLVSLLATAEKVGALSGIPAAAARRGMMPIVRQTLKNYFEAGPAASFTGPLARGDLGTVEKHLQSLTPSPEALECYVALARAALRNLPSRRSRELMRVLDAFSARKTPRSAARTGQARKRSAR